MEISTEASQKLKTEPPCDPAIQFQGIAPKDSRRYRAASYLQTDAHCRSLCSQ